MSRPRYILVFISLLLFIAQGVAARTGPPPIRVAVLDFGGTVTARRSADSVRSQLAPSLLVSLADGEESRVAARGVGYAGSLNLALVEARDLGAAMGCEYYLIGDAQTLRRSSSAKPIYYEAYASIFIVSGRTGRLIFWDRPSFEALTPDNAEKMLIRDLTQRAVHYVDVIQKANASERDERVAAFERISAVIEEAPGDDESATNKGIRLPQPYRRLRPAYPDTANRAEAEATVDVQVDIDAEGEVANAEVVRWAGFGLDEVSLSTVRQLHFRPATRDKIPVPMRVLLRYNFRKPPK